ncbi:MAG TPA: MMPL family transporter [Pilimelia sp.]|nr:MMPL family transporter [Pilimelia sp.]
MERLLERLGRATAGHPWRTLSAWLLAAAALLALGQLAGGTFVNDFRIPGAESQRAADVARDHFPEIGSASADVVWHAESGTLREPAVAAAIGRMLDDISRQPNVVDVANPLLDPAAPGAGGLVSADGSTATSTVRYDLELGELTPASYERLEAAAEPVRAHGVTVDFRGFVVDMAYQPETSTAELFGLGAALLVLLIAFGSVVAAGLPIVVAIAGLLVGTTLVIVVGSIVDIPTVAPVVAVMLGIGAGIDYALFVVTRYRRGLAAGLAPVDAVARAVATAGHAVLYAGATVVAAILGLAFVGIPFTSMMGLAAAITVAVMVVAALTLLPALLGLLGHRVNRLTVRLPWRTRAGGDPASGGWARWGAHLARHRIGYALAATAVLLAMAAPLLSLRLGTPDDGNQPVSWPQRRAYDTIAAEFGPGWNAPLLVTVVLPQDATGPAVDAGLSRLGAALAADPEVAVATPAVRSPDGRAALLTVVPRHAPQDEQVSDLVHRIRRTLAPQALDGAGRAYVGGQTSYMIDMADIVTARLPWMILGVVLMAGLLLVAMFRAPVVALKAALMTMLSIGAAYGVVVAVFQWGWGLSLLGVDKPVPIMSVVPMFLFAVLFGLSMDYEVFLLSAIEEEYEASGDPHAAVVAGLGGTGRVITAAAAIMAVVFVSFSSVDDVLVKMIGIGLAAAVILDATIIRVVLAPAVMSLLGHRAWWPRRRPTGRQQLPTPATDTDHAAVTTADAAVMTGDPAAAAPAR